MNSKNKLSFGERLLESAFTYTLISIIIGFIVGAVALVIAGYDPIESYGKLFGVIFRSTKNMSYSFIEYSVPYILTGLSVAFAFKTGVFNVGAEGQYVMGSVAAMLVGVFVQAPAYIHIPLCIITALVVGALWGGLVGFLKVRFGAHEVLCMIMFNWIAYYFSNFIVNLKSVNVGDGKTWSRLIQDTAKITTTDWLPGLSPHAHFGIFIALFCVVLIYYIINRTTLGFKLKAVGFNRSAAEYAGINANGSVMAALSISGMLASLAGALQVMGVTYKISQFAGQEGYGFQGITVALIGSTNPFGVLLGAEFFGAMKFGGTRFDAPSEIVDIIMGCIVLCIAISNLLRLVVRNKKKGGTV